MNVAIRAHRILLALTNFRKDDVEDSDRLKLSTEQLGTSVGYYQNPGLSGDTIGIFSGGLAWLESGRTASIRYSEIAEVTLTKGKESEGLVLKMHDGKHLLLPVRGQHGRFFDSLEMLRFLDRVLKDLRN